MPASSLDPGVLGMTYLVNSGAEWFDTDILFSDSPDNVGWTFDPNPDCAIITDPLGRAMTYAYDAEGDLASFTDRAGATARFTYDGGHRLLDIEDPRGVKPIRNDTTPKGDSCATSTPSAE